MCKREPVWMPTREQDHNEHKSCTDTTLGWAEPYSRGHMEYTGRHRTKGNVKHATEADSIEIFIKTLEDSHLCWTLRKGVRIQ